MSKIVCNINLFSQSPIILVKDDNKKQKLGYSSLPEIAKALTDLCYSHNTYDIVLAGASQSCASTIVEDINIYNQSKFSNKCKINIEVL